MITFLRKIRSDLLTNNKTGTYMLYAIGEITLVVVGILIAVSIDDRNEVKKQGRLEITYLNRLINEIKNDVTTFTAEIERLEKNNKTIIEFTRALKDKDCNDSTLVSYTSRFMIYGSLYPRFIPSVSTYEDLSSTGNLGLIRDTYVRDQIIAHYQSYQTVDGEFRINAEWAVPIDAPLFIHTNALRFDIENTSILFPALTIQKMAEEVRLNSDLYFRNASLHYWINNDCIRLLNKSKKDAVTLIRVLETLGKTERQITN